MTRRTYSPALAWVSATAAMMASGCGEARPVNQAPGSGAATAQQPQPAGSRYRDGTYTASGLYGGQPSKLTVTATVVDERLTDVSVRTHATNPISLDYQRRFAAAVPGVVRGRRIDEVKVGKLAGSSGCPDGFNAAVAKIREQAERT